MDVCGGGGYWVCVFVYVCLFFFVLGKNWFKNFGVGDGGCGGIGIKVVVVVVL